LGAFIERLVDYPHACLFDWDVSVSECNDLLVGFLKNSATRIIDSGT
jgi:hypothetical protein